MWVALGWSGFLGLDLWFADVVWCGVVCLDWWFSGLIGVVRFFWFLVGLVVLGLLVASRLVVAWL